MEELWKKAVFQNSSKAKFIVACLCLLPLILAFSLHLACFPGPGRKHLARERKKHIVLFVLGSIVWIFSYVMRHKRNEQEMSHLL